MKFVPFSASLTLEFAINKIGLILAISHWSYTFFSSSLFALDANFKFDTEKMTQVNIASYSSENELKKTIVKARSKVIISV